MKRDKGMALLMIMMLLALMAALAVGINQSWQSAFNRTAAQHSFLQAKWSLLGAEIFAQQQLGESLQGEQTVHLGQGWAQPDQAMRTEEGDIAIAFRDAQACFNINNLTSQNTLIPPPPPSTTGEATTPINIVRQVFDALLANQGFNETEIQQIAHHIEAKLSSDKMAFSDLSELRQIPGINQARFLQLKPLLCVLPGRASGININTLTDKQLPLLQALFLNKATLTAVKQLLIARPDSGWQSIGDADWKKTLLELRLPPLMAESLLSVNSRYFYLQLTIEHDLSRYQLQSLFTHEKQRITRLDRQIKYAGEE